MKGLREHPKGSGRYEFILRDPKRTPKMKYIRFAADDYSDAVMEAARIKTTYKQGRYDPWRGVKDDIAYAAEEYLKSISHMQPATISTKKSGLAIFLRHIDVNSFGAIDRHMIASFINYQKAASTKRSRLQILGSFWKWCMAQGFTLENPVEDYIKHRTYVPKEKRTRDAMRLEEYFSVYGFAASFYTASPHNFFPTFLELGVCTGLRSKELRMLNRRDITLDGKSGVIHIREWTNPKTQEHFVPKHGRERIVSLVPRAAALLGSLIDGMQSDDPFAPIFPPTKSGNIRLAEHAATKKFRRSRDEAGMGSSITLHSTRHSFLTWMIVLGIDPYAVMEIAGHANLEVQQRYIHFSKLLMAQNATEVKRNLVRFLCPGVDEDVLVTAFPDSRSWLGSGLGFSPDIMDVLFGGMLYDPVLVSRIKSQKARQRLSEN